MNETPHLSKDSYAVTNSSTERLCEWRGLNWLAGHEQKNHGTDFSFRGLPLSL